MQVFAAAFDHRGGVVDGDHLAVVGLDVSTQRLGHRAQRATEIIEVSAGLSELCRQHADVLDDGGVARYRPLDHVGKHPRHVFIEDEILVLGEGLGEQAVWVVAHGGVWAGGKTGAAL